jgi:alkaline phosphatase D
MVQFLLAAAALASLAAASFEGNLNYHSPSHRHLGLGIDIPKITKRTLEKRATPWDPAKLNFTHGVASGDPYPHSVILWTRIAPSLEADRSNVTVSGNVPFYNHDTEQYIKASPNPICLQYQVGTDSNFTKVVDKGTAYTTSDIDYTVKVRHSVSCDEGALTNLCQIEAKNLAPFKTYYYQFNICGSTKKSPLGRTKTSPNEDDSVPKIGLAIFSCSNYPSGYFNAYGNAARKDKVDYFVSTFALSTVLSNDIRSTSATTSTRPAAAQPVATRAPPPLAAKSSPSTTTARESGSTGRIPICSLRTRILHG